MLVGGAGGIGRQVQNKSLAGLQTVKKQEIHGHSARAQRSDKIQASDSGSSETHGGIESERRSKAAARIPKD